jgi:ketosteroid isomerase-like protein
MHTNSPEMLVTYADAWNARDADRIMTMMTDDCTSSPASARRRGASFMRVRKP